MLWASAKGLSSQCPVAFPLRVLLLGKWEAQTKSFFHSRTLGLLQPGNQPTPGALPFREPGRFFILLGIQVGTRTVRVQCMKQGTQSWCSGTTQRDRVGRGIQDWGQRGHVNTRGRLMLMYGKNRHGIVIIPQLK